MTPNCHADICDPNDEWQVGIPGGENFDERLNTLLRFIRMMNPDDWRDWRVHCYDEAGDLNVYRMDELNLDSGKDTATG